MESARIEKKEPLELPRPEEKLLRAPTFFEKHNWLKPTGIVLLLITTLILSLYYLLQIENASPRTKKIQPVTSATPSQITVTTDPSAGWKTYVSAEGKYSIKYPLDYTLSEASLNTSIISNILPNFKLTITYKPADNKTLPRLIEENKICNISPAQGRPAVVNGTQPAQLYLDNSCDSYITTVAYTINNQTLYIISVETQSKYSEIKQEIDKILATLQFLDSPMVACPADTKQCPDGTWIPRSGPNCKFICPLNGLNEEEKNRVEAWITENQLNIYGDPKDTGYAGGTPLFNEATGQTKDRFEYILEKHPDRPWNK